MENQPYSVKPQKLRYAVKGNTLAEYAGLGTFVVVACIVSISLFSMNFKNMISQVREDMRKRQQAPIAALLARQNGINNIASQMNAEQLATLESDLATKLQTTGANGSTSVLAQQLANAAQKLLDDGKISEEQYNILMQLSNQGHKMAETQGMIEDAVRMAGGDFNKFNNMKFNVDGQTYTGMELARMVGFDGPKPDDFKEADILTTATGAGSQMSKFLDLYNQALSTGALSDPDLRATVDSASTQIAGIGETTEDAIWQFSTDYIKLNNEEDLAKVAGEHATNMNSSKICKAGKFKDNGALCSP